MHKGIQYDVRKCNVRWEYGMREYGLWENMVDRGNVA